MQNAAIQDKVRAFIEDNFLFRSDSETLAADTSLLDAGLIDSTGILELVAFLEQTFGITVADAEIVPANLDSIAAIAAYVDGKLNNKAAVAA